MPAWKELAAALTISLPCPECARHYTNWYNTKKFLPAGRGDVRKWFMDLHNDVNRRRKVPLWTDEQLTAAYAGAGVEAAKAALAEITGMVGQGAVDKLTSILSSV
jgi:hypothetical protein